MIKPSLGVTQNPALGQAVPVQRQELSAMTLVTWEGRF